MRFPLSPDEAAAAAYVVKIVDALTSARGNTETAAAQMKMKRRTLDHHIARLGLRSFQTYLWSRSERQATRKKPRKVVP